MSSSCSWKPNGMSVRGPPEMISIGTPSRYASPMPLIACVMPAAGTMTSVPMRSPLVRLIASAMKAPHPSWVTSTGVMRSDFESSS